MYAYIINTVSFFANSEKQKEAIAIIKRSEIKMSDARCRPVNFGFRKASTSTDGNKLLIEIDGFCPEYIVQGDRLSFAITSCIDYPSTAIQNVIITVNGAEFTAIKFGNVKWDTIRARTCYTGIFGTEEPTFTILNDLPCSKFDYPVYTTNSSTFEKVAD